MNSENSMKIDTIQYLIYSHKPPTHNFNNKNLNKDLKK